MCFGKLARRKLANSSELWSTRIVLVAPPPPHAVVTRNKVTAAMKLRFIPLPPLRRHYDGADHRRVKQACIAVRPGLGDPERVLEVRVRTDQPGRPKAVAAVRPAVDLLDSSRV